MTGCRKSVRERLGATTGWQVDGAALRSCEWSLTSNRHAAPRWNRYSCQGSGIDAVIWAAQCKLRPCARCDIWAQIQSVLHGEEILILMLALDVAPFPVSDERCVLDRQARDFFL